jgi:hypothetical protein
VSSNAERANVLDQALHAGLVGDHQAVARLCTADVRVWTPRFSASSLNELGSELKNRDPALSAFSGFDLATFPLDVGGEFACVEWTVSMTHSAPLLVGQGTIIEATGLRVTAIGATVAEFRGLRICALRQYWDESALLRQLGLSDHQVVSHGA